MHFAYPSATDFAEALPVLRQVLTKRDVPVDQATHCLYVAIGYGCSFYPGQPKFAAAGTYGAAEALADLETLDQEKFGGPLDRVKALPWNLILPILFQLFQEWLSKRQA